MPANIKPVTGRKAPWPPKGFAFAQYVGGDAWMNWWSLAWVAGRENPWDLIIYNFGTEDPREVNYYLKEYVGCTAVKDSSYVFTGAKPGIIYFPSPSWRPPATYRKGSSRRIYSRHLAHLVALILRKGAGACPWLKGFGHVLTPLDLRFVAHLVETRRIKCIVAPAIELMGEHAEYDFFANEFYFKREPRAGSADDVVSVVHEGIHAALDARLGARKGILNRSKNEMLAHAASAAVVARLFPGEVERRLKTGAATGKETEYGLLFFGWAMAQRQEWQMLVDLDQLMKVDVEDPFRGITRNIYTVLYNFVRSRYLEVWKTKDTMDGIP